MKAGFDSRHENAVIFEDDSETGYLYLFSKRTDKIENHLHIYDRSEALAVAANDVEVIWSTDESKCAVLIWQKIKGIIDFRTGREDRAWLESKDTPGISDIVWLKGFEVM